MDAVHLATASIFRRARLLFVTWDDDLARAAQAEGLAAAGAV
jgi:predicted nucleic acid-binding protein